MITCTKQFGEYPFAHRQPTHDGHCKLIHGHNWKIEVEFACNETDSNGFVVDFGKLKFLKELFEQLFDHTLVISKRDPKLEFIKEIESQGLAKLTIVDDVSAEGLSTWLQGVINEELDKQHGGRVWAHRVRVYEQVDDWCDAYMPS